MVLCVFCVWVSLGDANEVNGCFILLEGLYGQHSNSVIWNANSLLSYVDKLERVKQQTFEGTGRSSDYY